MPAKEWTSVLRYAPCKYGLKWRETAVADLPDTQSSTGAAHRR